mgnify:CR=1 FL=1
MKTEKLTIRKMTTEDLFPLYHVPSDSEVMEYLEPPFSMEAAKQFLYKAGICETPLLWAVEDARKVFIGYLQTVTFKKRRRTKMAKLEQTVSGDFYELLRKIENGIQNSSMSASLEEFSDFESGTARCSVRVFERYSYVGDNRVSLNVTLFQNGSGPIQLSAIAAGGSQAMLFKINTWGEEAFLDKLKELL